MNGRAASDNDIPILEPGSVGWITTEQMVEVDRVMIEDLHIELVQMMENAGRNLAHLALRLFNPSRVVVMVGPGGNGGGGLVAARHLANHGVEVTVVKARLAGRFAPVPRHQLDIVERMAIPIVDEPPDEADLIVDALIGYSLRGAPRDRSLQLIDHMLASAMPILSLDNPSGLDLTTGITPGTAVSASATMTLAMPKVGLRDQPTVGDLYVADISVPPAVYERWAPCTPPDFRQGPIVRVAS